MKLPFKRKSFLNSSQSGEGKHHTKLLVSANTLLVFSVVIAFILLFAEFRNNSGLKDERNKLMSTVTTMSGTIIGPPSVEVGDIVPSFEAVTLEGKPTRIVYNGSSDYLLYIFSSHCGVCIGQFPNWNLIASRAKLKNYTVIGLAMDSENSNANLSKIDKSFEICLMANRSVQRAYRVVAVPLVMLVSRHGNVKWMHYGALSKDKIKEISSVMGLE